MSFIEQIQALNTPKANFKIINIDRVNLLSEVKENAARLNGLINRKQKVQPGKVLILMQNSLNWVVADFYCLFSGTTEVSIPLSFTCEQAQSLMNDIDLILTDDKGQLRLNKWKSQGLEMDPTTLVEQVDYDAVILEDPLPFSVQRKADKPIKIIHTSGSTGNPKGVMISEKGLSELISNLSNRLPLGINCRYLSIVPLSLLIEQVTMYVTLLRKGTFIIPDPSTLLLGEGEKIASQFLNMIRTESPTSMAVPPSIIKAFYDFVVDLKEDQDPCFELFGVNKSPFFTCGGAPVSGEMLKFLGDKGITIYEGYGLSENSSVVSLSTPDSNKIGYVGKPLDHVAVKLSASGELLIKSTSLFMGYVNKVDSASCSSSSDGWLKTGDIAEIDEEGFIKIIGRKKNTIINSNGRNLAPEWLESKIKCLKEIDEVVVFNKGEEYNESLVFGNKGFSKNDCIQAIKALENESDSFSRIERFHFKDISEKPNFYTISGKPKRSLVCSSF